MKLPEVKEVEPIEKRFHRVSSAAIDILKVCFFTFCYKMLIIVNNGHFPFNRSSGLKFWKFCVPNGTFRLYRPDPSHSVHLVIVLIRMIQKISTGDNIFIKWRGAFQSD